MYTTELPALRACASEKQVALLKRNKAGNLFVRCLLLRIFKQCSSLPENIQLPLLLTSDPVHCHRYFEARLVVPSLRSVFFSYPNCCRSLIPATVLHLIVMSFRTALKKTFAQHG